MSDFSTTLKQIRLSKGMSQEEFATFLGTSKQNISRYENGEVSPKISTAAKMAEKLGISLAQLNGDNSSNTAPAETNNGNAGRERVSNLFMSLSAESQEKLLDYALLLLKAERSSSEHRD